MIANKNINRIICAFMTAAVILSLLAVVFSNQLTEVMGQSGITMEYESKLFDTDEIITVDIQMSEDNWNKMLSNASLEEYYVCDVVVNGKRIKNVGIRPKGNTSLSAIAMDPDTNRFSLKLEFDHFVENQTCYGLDKLILNNNYADATNMKETVIYDMFQYLGADASLYNYAKLSVNGEYWGVYLALEGVEDSFMLRNYGTQSGELYKPESLGMGGGGDNSKGGGGFAMPGGNMDFSNIDFSNVDFSNVDFSNVDFSSFDPSDTDFSNFDFSSIPGNNTAGAADNTNNVNNAQITDSANNETMSGGDSSSQTNSSANTGTNEASGFGSMPSDMSSFTPGSMPSDMSSFDPSSMPSDMSGFTPGSMPSDMSSFSPGSMPGNTSSSEAGSVASDAGTTDAGSASSNRPDASEMVDFSSSGGSSGNGGANLNYSDDELDSYSTIWEGSVTNTSASDHRRVVTALKNISEGTNLEDYLDIDNILKYMAVHTFAVNNDSLSANMAHNYYLYEYDGKLNMIPWDYNLSLGGMAMGSSGSASDTINDAIDTPFSGTKFFDKLLENEEYLNKYHEYLQMLTEKYIKGGEFDRLYNKIRNTIDSLVETDPTAFYTYDEYLVAADMLYKTIQLRADSIIGQLNGTIPSTDSGQRGNTSLLIDASEIDVTVMGQFSMGGFGGGGFGGFSQTDSDGSTPADTVAPDASATGNTAAPDASTGNIAAPDSATGNIAAPDTATGNIAAQDTAIGNIAAQDADSSNGKTGFSRPGKDGNRPDSGSSGRGFSSSSNDGSAATDSSSDKSSFSMSSFSMSGMSFPGMSGSVSGSLQNIIIFVACFVIMIIAIIIIKVYKRRRYL